MCDSTKQVRLRFRKGFGKANGAAESGDVQSESEGTAAPCGPVGCLSMARIAASGLKLVCSRAYVCRLGDEALAYYHIARGRPAVAHGHLF
jgi:hypothetical protein